MKKTLPEMLWRTARDRGGILKKLPVRQVPTASTTLHIHGRVATETGRYRAPRTRLPKGRLNLITTTREQKHLKTTKPQCVRGGGEAPLRRVQPVPHTAQTLANKLHIRQQVMSRAAAWVSCTFGPIHFSLTQFLN